MLSQVPTEDNTWEDSLLAHYFALQHLAVVLH
jgi:hypothetical protein